MRRILAIHAHPDDVEILAGGTLALLSAAGHELTIATMTPGDCGSAKYTSEQIAVIRLGEAQASAALIHADYLCCGFSDLAIFSDDSSRRRVTEVLRRVRPDLVITSSGIDYMADHETTRALVRDACFAASAVLYQTGAEDPAPALPAIPHLYFMDPVTGPDCDGRWIVPDFCVDVSSVFEMKRRMLEQHASQRDWLCKQHGIDDYIQQMEDATRAVGQRFGVRYGEGFRRYRGHPYPQSPLLETLLGNAVRTLP